MGRRSSYAWVTACPPRRLPAGHWPRC
jgi:hypothetical protein